MAKAAEKFPYPSFAEMDAIINEKLPDHIKNMCKGKVIKPTDIKHGYIVRTLDFITRHHGKMLTLPIIGILLG